MAKLNFEIVKIEDDYCYDVSIIDDTATVADYISELDDFLDAKVAPCIGCTLCCSQRIPLTLGDFYTYAGHNHANIRSFLQQFCHVATDGRVDIRLKQVDDEACIFLDVAGQKCGNHQRRSLVCHSYICLPQTERARNLREALIDGGENALVGSLLSLSFLPGVMATAEDYPLDMVWEGKDFDQICLKDTLDEALYSILRGE